MKITSRPIVNDQIIKSHEKSSWASIQIQWNSIKSHENTSNPTKSHEIPIQLPLNRMKTLIEISMKSSSVNFPSTPTRSSFASKEAVSTSTNSAQGASLTTRIIYDHNKVPTGQLSWYTTIYFHVFNKYIWYITIYIYMIIYVNVFNN